MPFTKQQIDDEQAKLASLKNRSELFETMLVRYEAIVLNGGVWEDPDGNTRTLTATEITAIENRITSVRNQIQTIAASL